MADFVQKPCLQRQCCLLPLVLLFAGAACATEPPPALEALIEGVWWSSAEGLYDASAIEFTVTDGRLGGVIHFLEGIVRDFIAGEGAVMHSVLVVRDGRLVLEEYFHGHGRDDLHRIASCTKSVTSLLVGLAVDRGLIAGADAPVLDFFPAEAAAAAPGWKRLRLRHLLTMTAGLGWPAERFPGGAGPPGTGPELFRQVLAREPAHEPGTVWSYANPDVNLLAGVLRQATGQHADKFAAEHFFAPLGITHFDWSTWGKQEGYPNVAGSLLLRPRDMAKIGALVLTEGRWRGRQVVSADWIRAATRAHVENADGDDDYGYNNHLKSHFGDDDDNGQGKMRNDRRRRRQAEAIARIVASRQRTNSRFVITGDMNDPPDAAPLAAMMVIEGQPMINALANPTETRPAPQEQPGNEPNGPAWTHRFKPAGLPPRHELLDQVLLSRSLSTRPFQAFIDRRTRLGGDGSDHDPAWIEIDV